MAPRKPLKEPEAIGAIIGRWLRSHRTEDPEDRERLQAAWRSAVGEEIASLTRVLRKKKGTVTVEVLSAPLLNELVAFHRVSILESLQSVEEFRGVNELRFRAGSAT